jgi:hypothetical protein
MSNGTKADILGGIEQDPKAVCGQVAEAADGQCWDPH